MNLKIENNYFIKDDLFIPYKSISHYEFKIKKCRAFLVNQQSNDKDITYCYLHISLNNGETITFTLININGMYASLPNWEYINEYNERVKALKESIEKYLTT